MHPASSLSSLDERPSVSVLDPRNVVELEERAFRSCFCPGHVCYHACDLQFETIARIVHGSQMIKDYDHITGWPES